MYARLLHKIDPEDFFSDRLADAPTGEEYDNALESMTEQQLADGLWIAHDGDYYDKWEIIDDDELKQMFDEFLNEDDDNKVTIYGLEYNPARTLAEIDPTAYRTGFNDWVDDFIQWSDDPIIEL